MNLIHTTLFGLTLAGLSGLAMGANPPSPSTPAPAAASAPAAKPVSEKRQRQTEKMKACNAEAKAKALKGDERKAFMKGCLSAKPT